MLCVHVCKSVCVYVRHLLSFRCPRNANRELKEIVINIDRSNGSRPYMLSPNIHCKHVKLSVILLPPYCSVTVLLNPLCTLSLYSGAVQSCCS